MNKRMIVFIIAGMTLTDTRAEFYRCQSATGRPVFSDRPGEGCTQIEVKPTLPSQKEVDRELANRKREAIEDAARAEEDAKRFRAAETLRLQRQSIALQRRTLKAAEEAAKPIYWGPQLEIDHPKAPPGFRLPPSIKPSR